jgi:hypothetical protein
MFLLLSWHFTCKIRFHWINAIMKFSVTEAFKTSAVWIEMCSSQSQHLGPFLWNLNGNTTSKVITLPDVKILCITNMARLHVPFYIYRSHHQDNTVYVRIMWPGVHVEHALFNLQAVWRMNKVKLWKTCLRTEIVWVCFTVKIYQMPDSAWAQPFVTMVTSSNIFSVVFPQKRSAMLRMVLK